MQSKTPKEEYNEAITFFTLTMDSHLFSTVMNLSRFIDSDSDTLNINIFFDFVKNNLDLFSTQSFKKHLIANGRDQNDADHFARSHKPITVEIVEQDQAAIKLLRVHNIKTWQDKKIAHIQKNFVTAKRDVMRDYPIKINEIDEIINTLHTVLDRYLSAYEGAGWVIGLPPTIPQMNHIMDAISYYRNQESSQVWGARSWNRTGGHLFLGQTKLPPHYPAIIAAKPGLIPVR